MSLSNLPPGVSDYDIPGNRTEDIEWEKFIDKMMDDIDSPYEAREVWEQGLKSHNTQMHMDSNKVSSDCVCKKCGRGPYVNKGFADSCCQ